MGLCICVTPQEAMLGAMCTAHETEQVEVCALLLRVLPHLPQQAQATLMRCATQVLPLNLLARSAPNENIPIANSPTPLLVHSCWRICE